jgi:hypothetical protein
MWGIWRMCLETWRNLSENLLDKKARKTLSTFPTFTNPTEINGLGVGE